MRSVEEMQALFDRWNVPYHRDERGLHMESWGEMPLHLQQQLQTEQRTGGRNRRARRAKFHSGVPTARFSPLGRSR